MIEIKIVWIIANTIAAAWFSYTVLFNPILQATMHKWGGSVADKTWLTLLVVLFTFHGVIAAVVCLSISITTALIVTSFVGYGWVLISYFILQRFAGRLDRPAMVYKHPMFYPLAAFGGFLSSTLAISFFAGWWLAFLPFVLWLMLGFLCAEVAIRRYMREGDKCDRDLAIFAVNDAQGRNNDFATMIFKKNRYPFP
ncbi:MAG: hypothetical protein ABIG61_01035 [Planctomycetota bacterium]